MMRIATLLCTMQLSTVAAFATAPSSWSGVARMSSANRLAVAPSMKISASELKAEGEAAVQRRAEIQAAYKEKAGAIKALMSGNSASAPAAPAEAAAPAVSSDPAKVAALKAEGETAVQRRAEIQAAFEEKVSAAKAAKAASLMAAGEAAVQRRAEIQAAYEEKVCAAKAEKMAALLAAGEAAVQRRAEIQAAYEEKAAAMKALMGEAKGSGDASAESAAMDAVTALKDAQEALAAAEAEAEAELKEAALADAELEKALDDEEEALEKAVEAFKEVNDAGLLEDDAIASDKEADEFVARAEARVAARAAAPTAPAPAAPAPAAPAPYTPTMPPAASTSAMVKQSTLPPALVPYLDQADLFDPTTLSDEEQENIGGAVGFSALLIFLLPIFEAGLISDVFFSALFGASVGGYLALRKDPIGAITRDVVGDTSNKVAKGAYEKAIELEEEYDLTENAKKTAANLIDDLKKKVQKGL